MLRKAVKCWMNCRASSLPPGGKVLPQGADAGQNPTRLQGTEKAGDVWTAVTPYQSASLTASPLGEAMGRQPLRRFAPPPLTLREAWGRMRDNPSLPPWGKVPPQGADEGQNPTRLQGTEKAGDVWTAVTPRQSASPRGEARGKPQEGIPGLPIHSPPAGCGIACGMPRGTCPHACGIPG